MGFKHYKPFEDALLAERFPLSGNVPEESELVELAALLERHPRNVRERWQRLREGARVPQQQSKRPPSVEELADRIIERMTRLSAAASLVAEGEVVLPAPDSTKSEEFQALRHSLASLIHQHEGLDAELHHALAALEEDHKSLVERVGRLEERLYARINRIEEILEAIREAFA